MGEGNNVCRAESGWHARDVRAPVRVHHLVEGELWADKRVNGRLGMDGCMRVYGARDGGSSGHTNASRETARLLLSLSPTEAKPKA